MKKQKSESTAESPAYKYEQVGYLWKDRLKHPEILFSILTAILSVLLLLSYVVRVVNFFLRKYPFPFLDNPIEFIGVFMGVFISYQFVHISFNRFPTIQISQNGLKVQVFDHFQYTWQFVPWPAVQAIYPVVKDGWFPGAKVRPTYVIKVDNLSVWHYMFSSMYGNDHVHALIINPHFPKSDILLDEVRSKLYERDIKPVHKKQRVGKARKSHDDMLR